MKLVIKEREGAARLISPEKETARAEVGAVGRHRSNLAVVEAAASPGSVVRVLDPVAEAATLGLDPTAASAPTASANAVVEPPVCCARQSMAEGVAAARTVSSSRQGR